MKGGTGGEWKQGGALYLTGSFASEVESEGVAPKVDANLFYAAGRALGAVGRRAPQHAPRDTTQHVNHRGVYSQASTASVKSLGNGPSDAASSLPKAKSATSRSRNCDPSTPCKRTR